MNILRWIIGCLVPVLVTLGPVSAFPRDPTSRLFIREMESTYHISHTEVWHSQARKLCTNQNGELVNISGPFEERAIQSNLIVNKKYFIGGHVGNADINVCYLYVRLQGSWAVQSSVEVCGQSAGYICRLRVTGEPDNVITTTTEHAGDKLTTSVVPSEHSDVISNAKIVKPSENEILLPSDSTEDLDRNNDDNSEIENIKQIVNNESVLVIAISCSVLFIVFVMIAVFVFCYMKRKKDYEKSVKDGKSNIDLNFHVYNGIDAGNGSIMSIRDLGYDKHDDTNHYDELDFNKMNPAQIPSLAHDQLEIATKGLHDLGHEIDQSIYEELDEPINGQIPADNANDTGNCEQCSDYEDITDILKTIPIKGGDDTQIRDSCDQECEPGEDELHQYQEIGDNVVHTITNEDNQVAPPSKEIKTVQNISESLYAVVDVKRKAKTRTDTSDNETEKVKQRPKNGTRNISIDDNFKLNLDNNGEDDIDLTLWENDIYNK